MINPYLKLKGVRIKNKFYTVRSIKASEPDGFQYIGLNNNKAVEGLGKLSDGWYFTLTDKVYTNKKDIVFVI